MRHRLRSVSACSSRHFYGSQKWMQYTTLCLGHSMNVPLWSHSNRKSSKLQNTQQNHESFALFHFSSLARFSGSWKIAYSSHWGRRECLVFGKGGWDFFSVTLTIQTQQNSKGVWALSRLSSSSEVTKSFLTPMTTQTYIFRFLIFQSRISYDFDRFRYPYKIC